MASDAVQEWKTLGNKYFSRKMYVDALKSYNSGLKEDPKSVLLLSNRSATYLKLGAFASALKDANEILEIEPLHVKATHRKIKALCGLKRYNDASEIIDKVNSSALPESDHSEFEKLKLKIKDYLHQEKTGDYDIVFMLKAALQNQAFNFDYADYVGPIEERESPSKGRGLFATEDIKAGQLLIGCKAFALLVPENVSVFTNDVAMIRKDNEALARTVAKILTEAPEKGEEFYKLYAGPELGFLCPENGDDTSHVDLSRIRRICDYNSFEPLIRKTLYISLQGIWLLPSLINHMCYGCNCFWMVNGDFMLIRALMPIAKDDELTISYIEPIWSFSDRMFFEQYGFLCDCSLCKIEQKESKATHEKRQQYLIELLMIYHEQREPCQNEWSSFYNSKDVSKTSILNFYVDGLKSLRPNNIELNFHLVTPLMALSTAYANRWEFTRAAETCEKMYTLTKNSSMCQMSMFCVGGIILSYLKSDAVEKAKKWFPTLRESVLLIHGNMEVLDVIPRLAEMKRLVQKKRLSL